MTDHSRRSDRRSRLSTLFEVRGRSWFVFLALAVAAALVTWLLMH